MARTVFTVFFNNFGAAPKKGDKGDGGAPGGGRGGGAAEAEAEAGNVTGLAANKPKPKTPSKRSSTSSAQVLEIFEHWKSSVNATGAKLDSTRKRIITSALKMYSVDDLKLAATGISKSDFNMGRDPKAPGKRNCGINLVYRDAEHIEKQYTFH